MTKWTLEEVIGFAEWDKWRKTVTPKHFETVEALEAWLTNE